MSKRLNKRQQREQEELAELQAQETNVVDVEHEVDEGEDEEDGVVNPFAALDANQAEEEDESEEEPELAVSTPKKAKKKKAKKKKTPAAMTPVMDEDASGTASPSIATPSKGVKNRKKGQEDPADGMDEVDRALAELKLKYGDQAVSADAGPSNGAPNAGDSRQYSTYWYDGLYTLHPLLVDLKPFVLSYRRLLLVDPKNLDADAELRRFFGSKVVASSAQAGPNRHRPAASSKLRYTISKPKPTYPPATSLAGLGMRELSDEEVYQVYARKGVTEVIQGEKWFTFEHSGAWREVQRQFLGAVQSHGQTATYPQMLNLIQNPDPNELMALLQVYPWHVDTLLQMSEVYRLQSGISFFLERPAIEADDYLLSDIGAASDFAERALYAFDRCLIPSFSVSSGTCRVDFDRVENRPLFTALHRIISYLGRRGCWLTAFNFAKLLFALDPLGDPHGAALWLDFLAIKSNNGAWLRSLLNQSEVVPGVGDLHAYPGMAYAQAMAVRQHEFLERSDDHRRSDKFLQDAICTFPQVVNLLADKIGASLPSEARSNALMEIPIGFSNTREQVQHLLAHIYVSRSESLWKEASNLSWFEAQVSAALPDLDSSEAKSRRSAVVAAFHGWPEESVGKTLQTVPIYICRHVICSENTSWLGMLPPIITSRAFHAYDPLPPGTAISRYDSEYFNGVRASGRSTATRGGMLEGLMERVIGAAGDDPAIWQQRIRAAWGELAGRRELQGVPEGERENVLQLLLQLAAARGDGEDGVQAGGGGMPGGFPGMEGESDEE